MPDLSTVRSGPARLAVRLQTAAAGDEGMTTAEYAVGTVAACGFAGVLYKILTSSEVISLVTNVISKALHLL